MGNLIMLGKVKKINNKEVRSLNAATCAIDITHATLFLQRAGMGITAATNTCKNFAVGKSAHVQAACAADISNVFRCGIYFRGSAFLCANYRYEGEVCWRNFWYYRKHRSSRNVRGIYGRQLLRCYCV